MAKEKLNICIFYLCVHKRIDSKVGIDRLFCKDKFFRMLGETYHIPKALKIVVIKEMEKYNMIEVINNRFIKVLPLLTDPEENINQFYREIGLYN